MRKSLIATMIAAGLFASAPAVAQSNAVEPRLSQLEKRMNTVERVVSRNSGGLIQPEIGPAGPTASPDGAPASAPLADLQTRIASVENELSGFTGRLETAEHRLQQFETDFAAYRKSTDARLKAMEDRGASAPDAAAISDGTAPLRPGSGKPITGTTSPVRPAADDQDRAARLAAVAKPTGKDAVDKAMYAYNYGYRLWMAKFYPESETQLQGFGGKFPAHRLVSRAQNLLGMVYMDDGKPNLAAQIFYDNYSKLPDGERASDSLLNLAGSLTALKKPRNDICRVYSELNDVYGTKLSAAQKAEADRGRAANKCA